PPLSRGVGGQAGDSPLNWFHAPSVGSAENPPPSPRAASQAAMSSSASSDDQNVIGSASGASRPTSRYWVMPVPAGMSLPMMMFSLSPSSRSDLPSMAASVSTRVVSWNDAADSHESVASDALVMPISSGRPSAGFLPSCTRARLVSA